MSIPLGLPGLDRPTFRSRRLGQVRAELAPLLDRIATGTLQRELDGELPFEPVRWLKEAGYGALRVPTEYGGRGLSIPELTQTWVVLAAAERQPAAGVPRALRPRGGPPVAARPGGRPARLVRPLRGRRDRRQRLVGGRVHGHRHPADGAHPRSE